MVESNNSTKFSFILNMDLKYMDTKEQVNYGRLLFLVNILHIRKPRVMELQMLMQVERKHFSKYQNALLS